MNWLLCNSDVYLLIYMRKVTQRLTAAFLLAVSTQASPSTLPVIDVNNPSGYPGSGVGLPGNHFQQSYSANHTGLLSGFGLYVGAPDGTHLYSTVSIKVGASDGWQTGGWNAMFAYRLDGKQVDLTPFNLHVKAGDNIIFDVGPYFSEPAGSVWMTRVGLGQLYSKSNNSIYPFLHEDRSLAFTTWMIPDAVVPDEPTPSEDLPAPGAGVLMLLGLAMLGLAR